MILELNDIITEAGTQVRASINEEVVAQYAERMEEGDKFPAITVFHDGNSYYLADGFHRIMAASRLGFVDIEADVKRGTLGDATWYALGANKTNGQRLSRGDVRHAVEMALETWPDKTQQAIADQVGCSQGTVAKVKAELIPTNKLNIPETRVGKDGKSRPTSYKPRVKEWLADTDCPECGSSIYEVRCDAKVCRKCGLTAKPASGSVRSICGAAESEAASEQEHEEGRPVRVKPLTVSDAAQYADMAIRQLQRIRKEDPYRVSELNRVIKWIEQEKREL